MMKNNTIIFIFGGLLLLAILIFFVPFLFKDESLGMGLIHLCVLPLVAIVVPPLLGIALRRFFHKKNIL
jgi:hypothetical protein